VKINQTKNWKRINIDSLPGKNKDNDIFNQQTTGTSTARNTNRKIYYEKGQIEKNNIF